MPKVKIREGNIVCHEGKEIAGGTEIEVSERVASQWAALQLIEGSEGPAAKASEEPPAEPPKRRRGRPRRKEAE